MDDASTPNDARVIRQSRNGEAPVAAGHGGGGGVSGSPSPRHTHRCDAAFKGCSAVFHVAAVLGNSADGKSQPLGSGDVSQDVYDGGMIGTGNVIDAVGGSGSVKRMVYTSSMAAVSGARGATVPKGYE